MSLLLPAFILAAGCDDDSSGTSQDAAEVSDASVVLPDAEARSDAGLTFPDGGGTPSFDGHALSPIDAEPGIDGESSFTPDAGADGKQVPSLATIVVLPDTQYYASSYPSVFNQQTGWIVAQKSALNIAAVLHVGDVVDNDIVKEWTVANSAMRLLDGVVPYGVVTGNHDTNVDRKTMVDNYFSPASMPWIAGTMTPGQIENNYWFVDVGPRKWLVLGLEFGPRDAVVRWADGILKTYANYPAIIVTHAYLYSDGTRYDINVGGTDPKQVSTYQNWNPQYYGFTASAGINDGEAMYQKLVLPNSNVRMVVCGHQTGAARLTSTRPDGTTVHQMLSDYQWLDGANFGFGYLRILQMDYDKKTIQVQTFSPYLNGYLTDDQNQFVLPLNL